MSPEEITVNSDLLRKGRLSPEDEATLNKLLSQMTISSPGVLGLPVESPQPQSAPRGEAPQPAPMAAGPRNFIQVGSTGEVTDLDYAAAPTRKDVWQEGAQVLGRKMLEDGRTEVLRKVPVLDGFGRQSSSIVREIETPAHLNPNELKRLEYEKKVAELQNLRNPRRATEASWQKFEAKDGRLYQLDTKSGAIRPMVLEGQGQMEAALTPSELKEKAALTKQGRASAGVSTLAEDLRNQYLKLQELGGTTDPAKSAGENLMAWAQATGPGQMVGRAVGSRNQQVLDEIANTRPLLMAMIAQSTGISATQLNSNAELQFYLQAATDPTAGPQANLNALRKVDQMYGTGLATLLAGEGQQAPQAPTPAPRNLTPQDAQALQWAMQNPQDQRAAAIKQRLGVR